MSLGTGVLLIVLNNLQNNARALNVLAGKQQLVAILGPVKGCNEAPGS